MQWSGIGEKEQLPNHLVLALEALPSRSSVAACDRAEVRP